MFLEKSKRLGEIDKTTNWFHARTTPQQNKYLLSLKNMLNSKYFGEVGDSFLLVENQFNTLLNKRDKMKIGFIVKDFKAFGIDLSKIDNLNCENEEVLNVKMKKKAFNERLILALAIIKLANQKTYLNLYINKLSDGVVVSDVYEKLQKKVNQQIEKFKKEALDIKQGKRKIKFDEHQYEDIFKKGVEFEYKDYNIDINKPKPKKNNLFLSNPVTKKQISHIERVLELSVTEKVNKNQQLKETEEGRRKIISDFKKVQTRRFQLESKKNKKQKK